MSDKRHALVFVTAYRCFKAKCLAKKELKQLMYFTEVETTGTGLANETNCVGQMVFKIYIFMIIIIVQ